MKIKGANNLPTLKDVHESIFAKGKVRIGVSSEVGVNEDRIKGL